MRPLPYGYHWLEEEDIAQVVQALRSQWITQGPLVEEFENRVAAACGAQYGVAFSSGTAALHGACFAAGIGPGDEVITSPLTFVATANAVVYQGGTPVFSDVDPTTLNLDPAELPQRITNRTKAFLPVHFGGLPCAMEEIHTIAREAGCIVIEDACHALGAEWVSPNGNRERVGGCRYSEMTVFSFHPVKHITTGEGGMVLTNREEFRDRLRQFRHHGIVRYKSEADHPEEPWASQMEELGYNYRITDFQCALGIHQLGRLERFLGRRREIAAIYSAAWEELGLTPQPAEAGSSRNAWHIYVTQLPLEQLRVGRKEIFHRIREHGIEVQVHYLPVHRHPYYQRRFSYQSGDFPVAERYYERCLTLPLFPRMGDNDVQEVVRVVRRVVEESRRPGVTTAPQAPSEAGVGEWNPRS